MLYKKYVKNNVQSENPEYLNKAEKVHRNSPAGKLLGVIGIVIFVILFVCLLIFGIPYVLSLFGI